LAVPYLWILVPGLQPFRMRVLVTPMAVAYLKAKVPCGAVGHPPPPYAVFNYRNQFVKSEGSEHKALR